MAAKGLTDYESKRLENIKRNEQMLASLKLHSTLSQLSAQTKRRKIQAKFHKVSPNKKLKIESPASIRRSRRTLGIPPDASSASGLDDDFIGIVSKTSEMQTSVTKSARQKGHLSMRYAYRGEDSYQNLKRTMLKSQIGENKSKIDGEIKTRVSGSIDLGSMRLESDNLARVVPGRIMTLRFIPCADIMMIVAGNVFGDVGFWNVGCKKEDGEGIYLYHTHPGPVSGISIQPFSISKMFTCCYDGFIRLMDIEKETFDLTYSSDDSIYSLSQQPSEINSLYFGEGEGGLTIWDERIGKCTSSLSLHDSRINTIDFNPLYTNMMVTSSTDQTACIWDLRKVDKDAPESLSMISHESKVQSAYFSPLGSLLATTCLDDEVRILRGANYEEMLIVSHYNHTCRWLSKFRGIWGWDDSNIFIGNMKKGVDVISIVDSKNIWTSTTTTLRSERMSTIPCRFDAHPYQVGTLAAATSGGQVFLWMSS